MPIDPATGAIGAPIPVGSRPNKLAISSDGQFLYVGLDGVGAVQRIVVPTRTPDLQFSLGSDPIFGRRTAEDIAVLPGRPHSVAVSHMNVGVSPRHAGVGIHDDGVERPVETSRHLATINSIAFAGSVDRLYGLDNETTGFGFYRMTVGAAGITADDRTIQGIGEGSATA